MPIYEYICQSCGQRFSFIHKRLNEPLPPCPHCQSKDVRKQISAFNAASSSPASHCAEADACPAAGGHTCCPGCCHHAH